MREECMPYVEYVCKYGMPKEAVPIFFEMFLKKANTKIGGKVFKTVCMATSDSLKKASININANKTLQSQPDMSPQYVKQQY